MEKYDNLMGCLFALTLVAISLALGHVYMMLSTEWKQIVFGMIVLFGICCWLTARMLHRLKANRLVDEFLNNIPNNAVEYAKTRPEKEKKRLFARLEKFMLDYLNAYEWQPKTVDPYANYYLNKLYLIDQDKAKNVVERVRKLSLDKLDAMVDSKQSYEQILEFLNDCWNNGRFTMGLVDILGVESAREYSNALVVKAKSCIVEAADRIAEGEVIPLELYYGSFSPAMMLVMPSNRLLIKLSAHFVELDNVKIPLRNIIMLSGELLKLNQPAIYISPGNIKYLMSATPMAALNLGLVFEMLNRLPDEEHDSATEVREAVVKKWEKDVMAYLDFQDTLRRIKHQEELQREEMDRMDYYCSHND